MGRNVFPAEQEGHKNGELQNSPEGNWFYFEQKMRKFKPQSTMENNGDFGGKHLRRGWLAHGSKTLHQLEAKKREPGKDVAKKRLPRENYPCKRSWIYLDQMEQFMPQDTVKTIQQPDGN